MLSWDTTQRLIERGGSNPLLVALIVEELEDAIQRLQEKREAENSLSEVDSQLLRGFILKRHMLIKKLKELVK